MRNFKWPGSTTFYMTSAVSLATEEEAYLLAVMNIVLIPSLAFESSLKARIGSSTNE